MEVDAADMDTLKKYAGPLLMLAIFETVTITLWLALYVRKHKPPGGWCSSLHGVRGSLLQGSN